jgi:hypothetical protein
MELKEPPLESTVVKQYSVIKLQLKEAVKQEFKL